MLPGRPWRSSLCRTVEDVILVLLQAVVELQVQFRAGSVLGADSLLLPACPPADGQPLPGLLHDGAA